MDFLLQKTSCNDKIKFKLCCFRKSPTQTYDNRRKHNKIFYKFP